MKQKTNKKIAWLAAAALCAGVAIPAAALLFRTTEDDLASPFKGVYGSSFVAYADEGDGTGAADDAAGGTETAEYTASVRYKISTDGNYLLLVTNLEDVGDLSDNLGYKITVNDGEETKYNIGGYYTSIIFKTDDEGGTVEQTMTEIFSDNVAEGMLVYEIENYSGMNSYTVSAYIERMSTEQGTEETLKTVTIPADTAGGFSVQVEATAGDPAPTNESYTVLGGGKLNDNLPNTDGQYLGDLFADNYMEFHIYSPVAVKGAELVLVAASTLLDNGRMNDMVLSDIFEMYVDGDLVAFEDEVILPGHLDSEVNSGESKWGMWENVNLGTIDLNAGYTVVRLLCVNTPQDVNGDYRAGNFDRLDIVFPGPVASIETGGAFKTAYKVGETIDLRGLAVNAVYESGWTKAVTDFTVTDETGSIAYASGETVLDTAGEITLKVNAVVDGTPVSTSFVVNVYSDAVTVQAEANGSHGETESYTVLEGSGIKVNSGANGSEGTGCVESIAVGNKLTFKVYAEEAGTYDLVVRTCSTIRARDGGTTLRVDFAKMYSVSVGGVPMELENAVIPKLDVPEGGSIWFNWYDLELGSVTLEAGYNEITFECIGALRDYDNSNRTSNIDCIDLLYNSDEA